MKNTLVIIVGPTCAGKSTLEALLVKKGLHRLRSVTTRPIRQGEEDGREYDFVSKSAFMGMKISGDLIESVEFNDHLYGMTVQNARDTLAIGNAVVVCEPHGRKQFEKHAKEHGIKTLKIFVNNPSQVIYQRFLQRFADDYITKGDAAVENYAKRLDMIQRVEWSWVVEAEETVVYDLRLNRFDEQSVVPVLQEVMKLLAGNEESAIAA